jgi:5S rRNA maturation endonuclease (ribonuclease M5)
MKEAIKNYFSGNYEPFYSKYLNRFKSTGGNEYKGICPFHEDTEPSFCVSSETGQYYCQGCGKKGDIFHFYAKLHGLNTKDDFRKVLKGIIDDFSIPFTEKKKHTVKRYIYFDQNGHPLHRTCRTEPKDFYQQHYNNGTWISGLKGIEPVLYNLPDIMEAPEILIVEGEKDADNLAALGFCATTCAMGAKKWRDSYNWTLKGKNIVLIPDNDNQGREHMALIGNQLRGKADSLKLLELPDMPSKGDVSDYIEKFNGDKDRAAERISMLIESARPYEPPKKYSYEDVLLDLPDFKQIEIVERKAYLYPWLKQESISMVFGNRGVGKSLFAVSALDAITRGADFGPWRCEMSIAALYVDGEMTISDNHQRIDDLGLMSGLRKNRLYIYSDHYANQLGLPRANLTNETWRNKIKSLLTSKNINILCLDNLASLAPGIDENAKKDYDPINQWLLDLRFAGISTMFLHHDNKAGGQRGTSAKEDNLDISIQLKKPKDYCAEDGCRFVVNFVKARVRTKDLKLIANNEFALIEDESGQSAWKFKDVKGEKRAEILRLLDEGKTQSEVAEICDCKQPYVSRIKREAIEKGHLTKKGKLTQDGILATCETEF